MGRTAEAGPRASRGNLWIQVRTSLRLADQHEQTGQQALPSRISAIFYAGMEGLGGIELDNEESDNVGHYII